MSEGKPKRAPRLVSIDALRGLDMLVIIGGGAIIRQLHETFGGSVLSGLAQQLEHTDWHGFRLYDLIFPLFLFLSGVSLPLSVERRLQEGTPKKSLTFTAVRRALILVFLGILYNNIGRWNGGDLRYASVLGRIGLAWLGAALAVIYLSRRMQVGLIVTVLLGYWGLLTWVPVPTFGAGDLAPGHSLTDWVDQQWLPGRLHRGDRDPEGILGILPAIGTALLGVCAGRVLLAQAGSHRLRATKLILGGILAVGLACLWHQVFPINKNLWTSSFALLCAGMSAWLLGVASYWLDGPKHPRWIFPLVVIGANPITAYLLKGMFDFESIPRALGVAPGVTSLALALTTLWLLLLLLYRRAWFLRV